MDSFKFYLRGLGKLIEKFGKLDDFLTNTSLYLKDDLNNFGEKGVEMLKVASPSSDITRPDFHENSEFHSGTKQLKDSWKYKIDFLPKTIKVKFFVETERLSALVSLLETGARPHIILPVNVIALKFYVRRGGGWELIFSKKVNHPGFPANPFVSRAHKAILGYSSEIRKTVMAEIKKIIG